MSCQPVVALPRPEILKSWEIQNPGQHFRLQTQPLCSLGAASAVILLPQGRTQARLAPSSQVEVLNLTSGGTTLMKHMQRAHGGCYKACQQPIPKLLFHVFFSQLNKQLRRKAQKMEGNRGSRRREVTAILNQQSFLAPVKSYSYFARMGLTLPTLIYSLVFTNKKN